MTYDDKYEERKPFLDQRRSKFSQYALTNQYRNSSPWILTSISWLITIYLLLSTGSKSCPSTSSIVHNTTFEKCQQDRPGWSTDLDSMRSAVSYETRVFSGALTYDEKSNTVIRTPKLNPNESEYVGPPSDEIDAAWHNLLHGQYTILTEDEAAPFQPALTPYPQDDMFHFQPDVFHSLHCLNAIRMRIDEDYYNQPGRHNHNLTKYFAQDGINRLHDDHCLDHIRQSLMCHADLSPTPVYSWEGFMIRFSRGSKHTCRKWEPIRKWIDARNLEWNNQRGD